VGAGLGNCPLQRLGGSSRKPRSHHDLGLSVASLLPVSSFSELSLSYHPGCLVLAAAPPLPFQPLPPPLLPVHSRQEEENWTGLLEQ